jgi:hypothetical protein
LLAWWSRSATLPSGNPDLIDDGQWPRPPFRVGKAKEPGTALRAINETAANLAFP